MSWIRIYWIGPTWALLILALSGCASPTARPAVLQPAVPPNLLHPCPEPLPINSSLLPDTLRAYLRELRAHRLCRERHAALAAAVRRQQAERQAAKPIRPNPVTDWY